MFRTVLLHDIPQGMEYQYFRLSLLLAVQDISAGHYVINNETHELALIVDKPVVPFIEYMNRQLRVYRETLGIPPDKYLTVRIEK